MPASAAHRSAAIAGHCGTVAAKIVPGSGNFCGNGYWRVVFGRGIVAARIVHPSFVSSFKVAAYLRQFLR
jgi:hypothetical protein